MEEKIKMLKIGQAQHKDLKKIVLEDSTKEDTLEQLISNLLNEAIEARRKEQENHENNQN